VKIAWLTCPSCAYRFYIHAEQEGFGYLWFCPKCKHEFREEDSPDARRSAARRAD
jgi:hypothetical protein